jgi:DNA-binding NarL/FixJ family response regulator
MNAAVRAALVVDDDALFRMALGTILTKHVHCSEIIEAASFEEGLERLCQNQNIALALFDLSMPGMGSPEYLRAVRENYPDTRVIVVSASHSRRDVLQSLEAGAHGYIPKTLGVKELTAAVQTVVGGAVYVPTFITEVSSSDDESSSEAARKQGAEPVALKSLTPRQMDVLKLIVSGKSNKEIARDLGLGEGTVKIHAAALFRNLGVNSRTAAAAMGARLLSDY